MGFILKRYLSVAISLCFLLNVLLGMFTVVGVSPEPQTTIIGANANEMAGWNVSNAGDLNDDGYEDIIFGAPLWNQAMGRVYVFLGYPEFTGDMDISKANATLVGIIKGSYFGWDVSGGGDVNGDGNDDIVVGSPGINTSHIIYGRDEVDEMEDQVNWTRISPPNTVWPERFGSSVALVGDTDNDGYDDVVVGDPEATYDYQNSGIAYVVKGDKYLEDLTNIPVENNKVLDKQENIGGTPLRVYDATYTAQSFNLSEEFALRSLDLSYRKIGQNGYVHVVIETNDPTGGDHPSGSEVSSKEIFYVSTSGQSWYTAIFSQPAHIEKYTKYWIVCTSSEIFGNRLNWGTSSGEEKPYCGYARDTDGATGGEDWDLVEQSDRDMAYRIDGSSLNNSQILSGAAPDSRFGHSVAGAGDVNKDGKADVIVGSPGDDLAVIHYGPVILENEKTAKADFDAGTFVHTYSSSFGEGSLNLSMFNKSKGMAAYYYDATEKNRPRTRNRTQEDWDDEKQPVYDTTTDVLRWLRVESGTTRKQEKLLGVIDDGKDVELQVLNGTKWGDFLHLDNTVDNHDRSGLDIAYVSQSGYAIAAYPNGSDTRLIQYRIWNGTGWSQALDASTVGTGKVHWIILASHPFKDEMVLASMDDNDDIYVQVWDGDSWSSSTLISTTARDKSMKCFDVAYEGKTGRAIIVWSAQDNWVRYARYSGSTWSPGVQVSGGGTQKVWIELGADTNSDDILIAYADNNNDLWVRVYADGDISSSTAITADLEIEMGFDVCYEGMGLSEGLIVYGEDNDQEPKYRVVRGKTIGSEQTSSVDSTQGAGNPYWLELRKDLQTENIHLLYLTDDGGSDSIGAQIWNGTDWGYGKELEDDSINGNGRRLDIAITDASGNFTSEVIDLGAVSTIRNVNWVGKFNTESWGEARVRTSTDGNAWTRWSDWELNFSAIDVADGRYVQYEIKLQTKDVTKTAVITHVWLEYIQKNIIIYGHKDDDFGFSVNTAGDNNNDGYDDVIIGAPLNTTSTGSAHLFLGYNYPTPTYLTAKGDARNNYTGGFSGGRFGHSVGYVNDMSTDGNDEVIVGAPMNGTQSKGAAYVYFGGKTGGATIPVSQAELSWDGEAKEDMYGYSVSRCGDLDGGTSNDGIMVGAPMVDNASLPADSVGKVYIYIDYFIPTADYLEYVSGDDQLGMIQTDTQDWIYFRVKNASGYNVPGAKVNFTVTHWPTHSSGHSIKESGTLFFQATSDSSGLVRAHITLGNRTGNYRINVSGDNFTGKGGPTYNDTINATAYPGTLDEITLRPYYVQPSGLNIPIGSVYTGYEAFAFDDQGNFNETWTPEWGTDEGLGTVVGTGGSALAGYTAKYTAGTVLGSDNITVTNSTSGKGNQSAIHIVYDTADHLVYVQGDTQRNMVTKNLSEEIQLRVVNRTGTPVGGALVNFTFSSVPTGASGHCFLENMSTSYQDISNETGIVNVSVKLGDKAGNYQLNITGVGFLGLGGSTFYNQVNATAYPGMLTRIALTPKNVYPSALTVNIGMSITTFNAKAYDQYGNTNLSWTPAWGTTDGFGTVTPTGGTAITGYTATYTAGGTSGYDNLTVANGSISNKTCIFIKDIPPLEYIELTPMYTDASPRTATAASVLTGYKAIGYNEGGSINTTWTAVWSTSDGKGIVTSTGGTAATGFTASYTAGLLPGLDNITVRNQAGTIFNDSAIKIIIGSLSRISLTPMNLYPNGLEIQAGEDTPFFTAFGYDAWGNLNKTWMPTWGTTEGHGSIISTSGSAVTGWKAKYRSTGTLGCDNITVADSLKSSISNISNVEIIPGDPSSITIVSGNSQTGIVGQALTLPMIVKVTDQFGNLINGLDVHFNITSTGLNGDGTLASTGTSSGKAKTIAGLASDILVLDTKVGTNKVRAEVRPGLSVEFGHSSGTDSLFRITISPDAVNLTVNTNHAFNLQGWDRFGNELTLKNTIWETDIGSIETKTDTSCTFYSGTVAKTGGVLTARVGVVQNGSVINVLPGDLFTMKMIPDSVEMEIGTQQIFRTTGHDEFGNIITLNDLTWSTDVGVILSSSGNSSVFKAQGNPANGTISAAKGSISAIAQITIKPKSFDPIINGRVPDVLLIEDQAPYVMVLTDYEFDIDDTSENLRWYLEGVDETKFTVSGMGGDNDRIVITPVKNRAGPTLTTLILKDSMVNKVTQPLWINITPVNDKPVFDPIPNIILHHSYQYQFDYSPYISDVETPTEDLNLSVKEDVDEIHHVVSKQKVVFLFPREMLGLTVSVTITVDDGDLTDSQEIIINVTDDFVPELKKKIPDITMFEGETKKNVFDLDDYFADPDEDSIFFSYGQTHVEVTIHSNNSVDIGSTDNWNGQDTITFRAKDPLGAIAEDTIKVTVIPVNDPPEISGVPDLYVHYDADYSFDLTFYVSDEDNTTSDLGLSFQNRDTSLIEDRIRLDEFDHMTMILNFPKILLGKQVPIRIVVTDGIDTDSEDILVHVTDDWPPEIVKQLPDVVFNEDDSYPGYDDDEYDLNEYFVDQDDDLLFYSSGTKNVRTEIHSDGTMTFSAPPDWFGQEYLTIRATDADGALIEALITITVLSINDVPFLDIIPDQKHKTGLWVLTLNSSTVYDVDHDFSDLEMQAEAEDERLQILINGYDIIFIANEPLTTTVTLNVSDGRSQVSQTFTVKVTETKDAQESQSVIIYILLLIIALIILAVLVVFAVFYLGNASIDEVYLIYSDGRAILSLKGKNAKDMDEDIVSGMFTAIQDFINDTFADEGSDFNKTGIKQLQFGGKNIMIERGKNIYLAVIARGRPGIGLKRKVAHLVKEIETDYPDLENWNGRMSSVKYVDLYLKKIIKDGEMTRENPWE